MRISHSDIRRAWARSWVTRPSSSPSRSRSSDSVSSIGAGRRRRPSADVGSSSNSTAGSSASARASIARCCSPTESFAPVAARERRARARRGRAAGRRRARARRAPAAKRRLSSTVPSSSAGSCGTSADLAPQLERIALAHVGAAVANHALVGVGEPVEQPQQGRLAGARRAGEAGRACRDPCARARRSTGLPARVEATRSRSSKVVSPARILRLSSHGRTRADAPQPRADAGDAGAGPARGRRLGASRSSGTGSGRSPTSRPRRAATVGARRGSDHTPRYPGARGAAGRARATRRSSTARSSPSTRTGGRASSSCSGGWA